MHIFLGTALWGWGVDRKDALSLLDQFYESGGRFVDAAVNYPINKRAEDFGLSAKYLSEWISANPGADLGVLYKIGSVNNLGGPETALGEADIFLSTELASGLFGDALSIVSLHWDNRDDAEDIARTAQALARVEREGYQVGLSGVARPDLYAKAGQLSGSRIWIQVKENAATNEARLKYQAAFPDAKYIAYGINMGGVKLDPPAEGASVALRGVSEPPVAQTLREIIAKPDGLHPKPATLNHLALMQTWVNEALSGVILGPRSTAQLKDSLDFIKAIESIGEISRLRKILYERLTDDRQ